MSMLTFFRISSMIVALVGITFLLPIGTAAVFGETAVIQSFVIQLGSRLATISQFVSSATRASPGPARGTDW